MQAKYLIIFVFIFTILLGAYLRLVNLQSNPNGLYVDEASTIVNAWSIAETGKDEYGKSYPILFRFLGSYTPPLYTYLTAVLVKFSEPSVIMARLISAVSGVLLIPLIFIFLKSLRLTRNVWTTILTTLLLAISPWAIFYSRIGYETNLGLLLFSFGSFLLWIGLRKPTFLILGFVILALSTYAYQSQRLLSPLLILTYLIVFRNSLFTKEYKQKVINGLVVFFIILIPQISIILTPASSTRGLGLFYSDEILRQANELSSMPMILSVPLTFSREFLSQYIVYFSPRNLFFQPDSDLQRSFPELSVFYPWMVILYVVGLFSLSQFGKNDNLKFLLMLLLLSPIPASLAGDPFSTQRSLPLLIPLILVFSVGLDKLLRFRFKTTFCVLILLGAFSMISLYRSMAVLLPNERAKIWGYGFSQLAEEIKKRPDEKFLIDSGRIKPAYIELTFYLQTPPNKLQQAADPKIAMNYYNETKWDEHYKFDQVETRSIIFEKDIYEQKIIVGDEFAISEDQAKEHFLESVFEIKDPVNTILFRGFRTNPALKCKHGYLEKKCNRINYE